MSIEERKRTFEPAADIQMNNVAKRLRPGKIFPTLTGYEDLFFL